MTSLNRRTLLQGGAALTLASTLASSEANAATVVRRNVGTMALNDPTLVSYRKAVAAMKALPASDPRSWQKQSDIHLNNCPHGNWYFLPWHRAYLAAFERLCRQLSGDNNFALPYWDWTANPQLPAAFATPEYSGQTNPLFDATRPSQTVTISPNDAGPTVISAIYGETSFEVFGSTRPKNQDGILPTWQRVKGVKGPFESGPHDHVHTTVLGHMLHLSSPLDPIFWLHHCNVDRIWDHWNSIGRANSNDPLWRTFAFNGQFVNPSGTSGTTPYNTTVAGVLDIVSLGYRYALPIFNVFVPVLVSKFINPGDPIESIKLVTTATARINVATTARAQLAAPQALALNKSITGLERLTAATTADKPAQTPGRIIVFIRDIEGPMDSNADVRVFINLPDANPETSIQDRHYASSFTFFGVGHGAHGGHPSYMLDITRTVSKLNLAGIDFAKEISVQLVPVPIRGVKEAAELKIGSVEVAIF